MAKNSPVNAGDMVQSQSLGQEDPLENKMATHSNILAENPMDRGTWWATVHRVTKVLEQLGA